MASAIGSAYDYYLTTYGSRQASRYDSHRKEDLRKTVNKINLLNKESPLYKVKISGDVQKFAIDIKENARSIKNIVASFSETDEGIAAGFHKKIATSSNPDAVTAEYIGDSTALTASEGFDDDMQLPVGDDDAVPGAEAVRHPPGKVQALLDKHLRVGAELLRLFQLL